MGKMTTIVWNEINLRAKEENLPERNGRCLLLLDGTVREAAFTGLCFTAAGLQMRPKTGMLWAKPDGHKAL